MTARDFRKMVGLCGGDRDLAERLSGYGDKVIPFPRPRHEREEPREIDWSDCPLAKRYGVR